MREEGDLEPRRPVRHEVGADLAALSTDEIDLRVALLEAEIERLRDAKRHKERSRDAASAFFKR